MDVSFLLGDWSHLMSDNLFDPSYSLVPEVINTGQ